VVGVGVGVEDVAADQTARRRTLRASMVTLPAVRLVTSADILTATNPASGVRLGQALARTSLARRARATKSKLQRRSRPGV